MSSWKVHVCDYRIKVNDYADTFFLRLKMKTWSLINELAVYVDWTFSHRRSMIYVMPIIQLSIRTMSVRTKKMPHMYRHRSNKVIFSLISADLLYKLITIMFLRNKIAKLLRLEWIEIDIIIHNGYHCSVFKLWINCSIRLFVHIMRIHVVFKCIITAICIFSR